MWYNYNMELIKYLKYEYDKNGNKVSYALFLCSYCNREIKKRLSAGKRDKSCGCKKGALISESKKGIKKSEEHKQKISKTRIENGIAKGENNPFYGKNHKEETILELKNKIVGNKTREKISISIKNKWKEAEYREKQINRNGEKSSNWQGGISFIARGYGIEFNKELKQQILERDNYTCQNPQCGIEIGNYKGLDVHHIDYNKKNNDEENLITLCKNCHAKTFGKNNRQYWINYYRQVC